MESPKIWKMLRRWMFHLCLTSQLEKIEQLLNSWKYLGNRMVWRDFVGCARAQFRSEPEILL